MPEQAPSEVRRAFMGPMPLGRGLVLVGVGSAESKTTE